MVAPPRFSLASCEPSLAAYSPPAAQHPGVRRNHPSSSVTSPVFSTSRALSPVFRSETLETSRPLVSAAAQAGAPLTGPTKSLEVNVDRAPRAHCHDLKGV